MLSADPRNLAWANGTSALLAPSRPGHAHDGDPKTDRRPMCTPPGSGTKTLKSSGRRPAPGRVWAHRAKAGSRTSRHADTRLAGHLRRGLQRKRLLDAEQGL